MPDYRPTDSAQADRLFEALVPPLVRSRLLGEASPAMAPSAQRLPAAVMFADLSGFSALAEELAPRGTRGAEDLRDLLNLVFGRIVALVDRHGGQVLSFPGDAVVALWLTGTHGDDEVRHAVTCALAIQHELDALPGGTAPRLRMRAGIGLGELWAANVGGVSERWHMVAAGEALRQAIASVAAANPGDVVVSGRVWELVQRDAEGWALPSYGACVRAVTPAATPPRAATVPALAAARLRSYVPRAVQAKVDAGQTQWLAEFRRVSVLFVNIGTIDTTTDGALDRLQRAAAIVQDAVDRYGGSINQLIADDKGTVVACGWGLALHAHRDDAVRAARAALSIDRDLRAAGLAAAFGLATGEVFTGLRGDTSRCDYAMIGSAVNLAARLMELATEEILCDGPTFEAAMPRIRFERVGARAVRGFNREIQQYRIVEGAAGTGPAELVGRGAEQTLLGERLDALLESGNGSVVVIEGDAGIGKSRLLADLLDRATRRAVRSVTASGDAIERSRPYHVWHHVFDDLLGLGAPGAAERRAAALLEAEARLQPFASLLNPVLGFAFEETERARDMTPRGRAQLTRDLLVHLFSRCIGPHPALLVLDDTQWFDSGSWALADAIQRTMPAVLLVVATRPVPRESRSPELERLCTLDGTRTLRLQPLSAEATRELVCQRLHARVLEPAVERLIADKAEGHPFFTEELANALSDRQLVRVERGVCRFTGANAAGESLALPNTVQVMVSSRIDQLSIAQQLTIKVASVLGQSFELALLQAIHPLAEEAGTLGGHCESLVGHDLLRVVSRAPMLYAFKHALTQEVAYSLLPYSQRRQLHTVVAQWLERHESAGAHVSYPLLAHHWGRAEVSERAIFYLEKAADQSLARFANQEAARFYAEALATAGHDTGVSDGQASIALPRRHLTPGEVRRLRWQRRLGDAYANLGRWGDARQSFESALGLIGRKSPASPPGWLLGIGQQLATQCGHRLAPSLMRRHSAAAAVLLREVVCTHERLGAISYFTERLHPMIYNLLAALNLAEQISNPEVALVYADVGNAAGMLPAHRLARVYNRMARDTAEASGNAAVLARVLGRASLYRVAIGDWSACADLERSLELCEHVSDPYQWEESAAIRARAAHFRGEYALAESLGREIRRRAVASGSSAHEIWGIDAEAWALWFRGKHGPAAALAHEGLSLIAAAARPDRVATLDLLGVVALSRLAEGDVDAAVTAVGRVEALLSHSPRPGHIATLGISAAAETWIAIWESRPATLHTPHADARAIKACLTLERYCRVNPPALARAHLCRGSVEWLRGRPTAAHQAWRRALDAAERFGLPYERGRAHYEIARHLEPGDTARHRHLIAAEREFLTLDARFELSRLAAVADAPPAAAAAL